MEKVLVVGCPSGRCGEALKKVIDAKFNNLMVEFAGGEASQFSGHPLANIGVDILEAKAIDCGELKDNRFNSLPEKQTYTPPVNRKTKRW